MKIATKEWTVDCAWGKVAMVSWGNPANPPILLVHGYMDSAATFILLVEQLPDTYYYVGFDIPGHGKSDPFPPGLVVSKQSVVEVIRIIVKHMKWDQFIYISHSMGFIIGVFYNHLFPGKITKMVHIDPGLPLSSYYFMHNVLSHWYQDLYGAYYSSYDRWNAGSSKRLTLDEAVNLLASNRNLTEEQAEIVLSRSLVPAGEGKFKLSWDTRMKKISSVFVCEETLYTVITQHAPPMLILEASESRIKSQQSKQFAENIFDKCRLMVPNFFTITVTGGHDLHLTNTENIVPHIVNFLTSNMNDKKFVKSKI